MQCSGVEGGRSCAAPPVLCPLCSAGAAARPAGCVFTPPPARTAMQCDTSHQHVARVRQPRPGVEVNINVVGRVGRIVT